MKILKNTFLIIGFGLVLSGCATSQVNKKHSEISSKIVYAPAIDVSYSEVSANVDQNIGTNVRWGGQVINSETIDDSTLRLTVFSYPLSIEGRPIKTSLLAKQGGRFIVDLTEGFANDIDFNQHFITFYGDIASSLTITNGNRQKTIPIVNAQELVDWNIIDENSNYVRRYRGNAFHSLAYRNGHLGFGYPYYGRRYYRTGNRFSSFGHFSRRGYFGGRSFSRSRFRRY